MYIMKTNTRTLSLLSSLVITSVLLLAGCTSQKEVAYLQDLQDAQMQQVIRASDIALRPGDKISILVNSKDKVLSDMFNLPVAQYRVGSAASGSGSPSSAAQGQVSVYTLDTDGEIVFPFLGRVGVAGMKRSEVAELIRSTLVRRNLVRDPVVTVEFANLYVSVLGEVKNPGRYAIENDRLTLLDAIGMAGDLTIMGKRKNITVLREGENGSQTPYRVDLTSAKSLYSSPVYYLQQKDVVYVEPNTTRARQSTVNGNNVVSTSFWVSVASLLTSICVLIFK